MKTFSEVNKILCVRWTSYDYREPFKTYSDFPTDIRVYDFLKNFNVTDLSELEIIRSHAYGIYEFKIKSELYGHTWKVQLIDGEKTRAIQFTREPIPCPKVRAGINTRYNGDTGYWEKQLKTGWCSA